MRLALIPVVLLTACSLLAQPPLNSRITHFTEKDGLPEEQVNDITQDQRGFIWIGSREGLIRFDGLQFRTWYANLQDENSFRYNNIQVVGEYKPGKILFLSGTDLWTICTVTYSLSPVKSFLHKSIHNKPKKVNVNEWIAADADSIYITNNSLEIQKAYPIHNYFPEKAILQSTPLNHPYILLSTSPSTLLYVLNTENGSFSPIYIDNSFFDNRVKFIMPQAYDTTIKRLYFSAYFNGFFFIDLQLPGTKHYIPVKLHSQPSGRILTCRLFDKDWLLQGGDQHFYLTDTRNDITYNLGMEKDLQMGTKIIHHFFLANDSSIWISTKTGIAQLTMKKQPVSYFKIAGDENKDADISCLVKGADGHIYYLDAETGLNRLSASENSHALISKTTYSGWNALADGENIIFTGAGKSVQFFNTRTNKLKEFTGLNKFYSRTTDQVTLVYRSRNGDLWYSCNGGSGILRQKAGSSGFIQYSRNNNPPTFSHGYVHTATEDSKGNIWWGNSKSSSLLKWDALQQQFEEKYIEEINSGIIRKTGIQNLFADSRDYLWIVTDGSSLIRYDPRNDDSEVFSIHNGLPTESVLGITEDSKKRIWISTRKGLSCFLPEKKKFITFTRNDGLPEENFYNKGIFYDNDKDLLWVAGKKTIAYFHPGSFLENATKKIPAVFTDEIFVNGEKKSPGGGSPLFLNPEENNIQITYNAVDFTRNNHLEFQYKLNEGEWTDAGENRTISFHNMQPGNFELYFRCKYIESDLWGPPSIPVHFIIKKPWYKTTLFTLTLLAAFALMAGLMIRAFYLYKFQKQKALSERNQAVEKERTRIATDMHDDFGASLSRIKFISEKLRLVRPDDGKLGPDLAKISVYSDEMSEKLNEIVWALNQRYDNCADLVSFCRSYAAEYMQDKPLNFAFDSGNIPDKKIQAEARRNIFLVMKEALHNIVKHANATEVSVHFAFDNGISIRITDNGTGFDPDHIRPFANGLENMKKRMNDIGGKLQLNTEKGTCILLTADI